MADNIKLQSLNVFNARSEARNQMVKDSSEALAKLITILIYRTIVLLGVAVLTYFCGPSAGLGTLAVVFFFLS